MRIDAYEQRLIAASFAASAALHATLLAVAPLPHQDHSVEPPRLLSVLLAAVSPSKEEDAAVPPPPPRPAPRGMPKVTPTPAARDAAKTPAAAPSPLPEPGPASALERPSEPAVSAASPPVAAATPSAARESVVTQPDFRAAYLRNPPPPYPASARRNGDEGTVTLRVLVSAEGLPQKVELERSSGSNALDLAALESVRQWRFVPARRGGEPHEAWVIVPIIFRLAPGA